MFNPEASFGRQSDSMLTKVPNQTLAKTSKATKSTKAMMNSNNAAILRASVPSTKELVKKRL